MKMYSCRVFDRLTLITTTGATIDDPSGVTLPTVNIVDSQGGSEAEFDETNVIGNGSNGVVVRDLSFAKFSTSNVTSNLGGTDVNCKPQFPATRGALTDIGGGTTNCVEP